MQDTAVTYPYDPCCALYVQQNKLLQSDAICGRAKFPAYFSFNASHHCCVARYAVCVRWWSIQIYYKQLLARVTCRKPHSTPLLLHKAAETSVCSKQYGSILPLTSKVLALLRHSFPAIGCD